ncbi:MAG TPA: lysylphosphatidylglycerol synthase transmembrane domain-containing protein [Jiangellaceae bacterium]
MTEPAPGDAPAEHALSTDESASDEGGDDRSTPPPLWRPGLARRLGKMVPSGADQATERAVAAPDVSEAATDIPVDEPPLPKRTRRPIDGLRLVMWLGISVGIVILSGLADASFWGLHSDLRELGERIPSALIGLLRFLSDLAAIAIPPTLAVILMLRGRVRTTIEMLVAAAIAAVLAAGLGALIRRLEPAPLEQAFDPIASEMAQAVPVYPALLVAIVTVISRLDMRRINLVAIFAIVGAFAVGLLEGEATIAGTLVAVTIGRTVGIAVRMVSGRPSVAPGGRHVAGILKRHGHGVTSVRSDPVDEHRRYVVETTNGTLGVMVLDRDNEGAGLIGRVIDRLRTREEVLPRQASTMRRAIDQMTLLSLAVNQAGGRTPRLHNVLRLGTDAALIVQDHIPGRPIAKLSPADVTDETLRDLWKQLGQLRRNQVAHRRLSGRTILVDDDGRVWLLRPSGGEVAAPDLALRTDLAQALVAVALVVGPERATETAIEELGATVVASALPLLQPVALARATRLRLREDRKLLGALRDSIVGAVGWEPDETIRVERIRPLSLVTGLGALAAVYLVGTQLTDVGEIIAVLSDASWAWLGVAFAAMALQYVGAAYALLGFVPERVKFSHALGSQVSLGFVRLISPATVGISAINLRLLTKAGIPGPLAAASIGANQIGAVGVTLPLIAVLGVVSGRSATVGLTPSSTALIVGGAIVAAAVVLVLIPPIRKRARAIWNEFTQRGLPRLLDVLGQPKKLIEAIGGILLQTLSLVMCFYACVRALGGDPSFAALAVVQMVGNAVGMAVPTPGGLGAVEAALTAGISTIGVSAAVAVPSVLLFRIVSFWLPILPGWILWTQLQRRNIL